MTTYEIKTKRKGNKRDFENAKIKKIVVNYQELNRESQQHCTYF